MLFNYLHSLVITLVVSIVLANSITLLFRNRFEKFSLSQSILIFSFATIISIPLLGPQENDSLEKRILAKVPTMRLDNIWQFFFDFDNYFTDRMPFRNASVTY